RALIERYEVSQRTFAKGGEAKQTTFAHSPVELGEARQQAQALRVRADSGDALTSRTCHPQATEIINTHLALIRQAIRALRKARRNWSKWRSACLEYPRSTVHCCERNERAWYFPTDRGQGSQTRACETPKDYRRNENPHGCAQAS